MEIKNTRAATMFFLIFGIQGIAGILVEQPENIAAMLSETAIFKCKSDKGKGLLEWMSFVDVSNKVLLWNGYTANPNTCNSSYCLVDSTAGHNNLKITATNETAKHYICIESGEEQTASASLIVIESKLKCTFEKTPSDATLSCAIGYYGQWPPQIKWRGSDGKQVNEESVTKSNENGKVTSTLTTSLTPYKDAYTNENTTPNMPINTTVKVPPAAGLIYFTAFVHFNESLRPTEVTAKNFPNYTDEWTSPPFRPSEVTAKNAPSYTDEWTSPPSNHDAPNSFPTWAIVLLSFGGASAVGGGAVLVYRTQSSGSKNKTQRTEEGKHLNADKNSQPV